MIKHFLHAVLILLDNLPTTFVRLSGFFKYYYYLNYQCFFFVYV